VEAAARRIQRGKVGRPAASAAALDARPRQLLAPPLHLPVNPVGYIL